MSIISASIKSDFSSAIQELYDDLTTEIVVHKEPIKQFTSITNNPLYGYGNESEQSNITYTPVSGIFDARVRFDNPLSSHPTNATRELNIRIPKGGAVIETTSEVKDYILNGKTERIDIHGKSFNVISDWSLHDYLGLKFYYFTLENTL